MKQRIWIALTGFLTAAILILLLFLFSVRQGEAAIVTTFGKISRTLTDAGLYMRWPWPIQRVHRYDLRLQVWSGGLDQTLTSDGKNVLVSLYAGWRIEQPDLFFQRLGVLDRAAAAVEGLLRNSQHAVLGRYPFAALVNTDPAAFQFDAVERDILAAVQTEAQERYGLLVEFVGLRQLGLPESIAEKVYERMRAEREEVAERYRAEGEGESIRIRAEADSRRDQALAQAEAEARRIRAEGDAAAAEHYKTFAQNPDLAHFLKKLEVLEETLKTRSTVILSADTEPYDLLRGAPQREPSPPQE